LKLVDVYFSAKSTGNPAEARRTVVGLGIGKHVMARNFGGLEVHGLIQEIGPEHFTVLPDHQTQAVSFNYAEIMKVEPNMNRATKILIGVGIGILIFGIVIGATGLGDR
jgi:hypothetical protein